MVDGVKGLGKIKVNGIKAVTSMMEEGHTFDAIYLDFAKAFDAVNHRFLLAKIKSFGLGDVGVRWNEA